MTLPAKKRQRFRLEHKTYWYVFTPHKSDDHARLIVEAEYGQGPKLIVQWVGLLESKRDTIPRRFLRATIEHAIALGWEGVSGSQFELGCDATGDELVFSERPKDAGNDWFLKTFPQFK